MSTKVAFLPKSIDDDKWLLRSDQALADALKTLQVKDIVELLQTVLAQMQNLDHENDDTLHIGAAIIEMARPVVQQYRNIVRTTLERYAQITQLIV